MMGRPAVTPRQRPAHRPLTPEVESGWKNATAGQALHIAKGQRSTVDGGGFVVGATRGEPGAQRQDDWELTAPSSVSPEPTTGKIVAGRPSSNGLVQYSVNSASRKKWTCRVLVS